MDGFGTAKLTPQIFICRNSDNYIMIVRKEYCSAEDLSSR
jgi:hypothetical protein